jgi:outer membrane receptor protein involved in Fe transport
MKLKFLFLTLFICTLTFGQTKGTISGIITDRDSNNQALPLVNVLIKETKISTNTGATGQYSLSLSPGNYVLQFSAIGYETIEIPVSVHENKTTTIDKKLGTGSYKLKDVIVQSTVNKEKETALLLEQKKAVVIKQSIGAQEMSRKGVSDAEEGLTKITGITKVGSRGLFVRGLEDRYNNLLINDLAAPTNNPFKKVIPLDIFSTDIIGVIEVYKTFNPNIYGDFAGGTFNIQTSKGSKIITKLSIGAGYTANNNVGRFLISKESDSFKGYFGFTGSDRNLPNLLGSSPLSHTFSTEESLKSFKSGFDVAEIKTPLNTSISFLHTEKFDLKDNRNFSYLLSINFDNNYTTRNGVERNFTNNLSGFTYRNDFLNTEFRYKTSLTSLMGLNYNTSKLKLSYNTIFIKTSENLIKDQFGVADSNSSNNKTLIRTNQLDKSLYLNNQLSGEYFLTEDKNQTIKAGVSYARTKYAQPDRKFFSGTKTGDNEIITSIAANNFIKQYLDISGDSFISGMAEYTLKFGKNQNKLTVGYNGNASVMNSTYRFITPINNSTPNNFTAPLNHIDTKLNSYLSSNAFSYRESSNATYQAKLNESTNAAYTNLHYKFNDKWEVNGGLRLESTSRETKYRTQGSFSDPFKKLTYDNLYILPALNVKYGVNENSNIRFATAKTYTKPVIMEAYPIEYINADGTSTRGNPFLVNSDNYNVDLKYELFPTNKEMFAVGLFGKKIGSPIERTFIANAANSTITTYLKSDNSVLYGAEFEFLLELSRINKSLKDFSLGFNTSLMHTKVEVSPTTTDGDGNITTSIETHRSRELQGASKWLINSDLKYQFNFDKTWTNTVSFVYSVFGKRIYAVGTGGENTGLDHIYELPVQQLDLVWISKVSSHIDLKFTADNLLNPSRQYEQGNNSVIPIAEPSAITSSYKKGRGFALNLSYTF